jgi:Nuclease-related domain
MAMRQREKIARLERSAAAWEAGAVGERATGAVLAALDPADWSVLHDVRWPGRARANIDHVAVGPGGVFVIDSKNWSGAVNVKNGVLRQNGYSREKEVDGVSRAAQAVRELVRDTPVYGMMCFARDESVDETLRDVMVCSTANLHAVLTARPVAVPADQVRRVAALLARSLETAGTTPTRSTRKERGRTKAQTRSGPSGWRVLAFFVTVALMIAALQTGLATKAADSIAELIVGSVVEDPSNEEPAKKKSKKQSRGERRAEG